MLIVGAVLFLALPQLAGWLVTRLTRSTSWVTWPAAAISVFSAFWYSLFWLPRTRSVDVDTTQTRCGSDGIVAAIFMLTAGLVLNCAAGVIFGMLARRRSQG